MNLYWILVALLHSLFALCELFPWGFPLLLRIVSKKLPEIEAGQKWTPPQQWLVATIVHNAGIYNVILAGGLFWVALGTASAESERAVAGVLLAGAALAGIFGTVTLKSPLTALQGGLGILGLMLL